MKNTTRILVGDALTRLRELPDESVHCCLTSPPYFNLRDYGTATWTGGKKDCDHLERTKEQLSRSSTLDCAGNPDNQAYTSRVRQFIGTCKKCGAKRRDQQMGLESTPQEYVDAMVAVFREVRRVLRSDGVFWLNIGDSYSSAVNEEWGLKPKDLIGIPWRLAFALQADGWWLRKDNIWFKTNVMPESCKDRTTSAHEYVFHFTKSADYWYDDAAIAEPADKGKTRNCRSVWPIPTQGNSDAHFAVMAETLARRCILAGCPEGGVVLDPFGGAGTTGKVSNGLNRDAILVELGLKYAQMAQRRIRRAAGLFNSVIIDTGGNHGRTQRARLKKR